MAKIHRSLSPAHLLQAAGMLLLTALLWSLASMGSQPHFLPEGVVQARVAAPAPVVRAEQEAPSLRQEPEIVAGAFPAGAR